MHLEAEARRTGGSVALGDREVPLLSTGYDLTGSEGA